jgi:selenocysteine-specific translation elongation factor
MAASVTVALVGDRESAAAVGKKGTQSDITLFNAVRDGHAATVVEPTQFPEKLAPLLTALSMADRVVVVVPALNREIAEVLAAVDLVDRPVEVRLGPGVGEAELRRAVKGMRFEADPMPPLDLPRLRDQIDGWGAEPRPGPVAVPIDHAFPVKGVGTVTLGVVRRGTLTAHDKLRLYPTELSVEVRSIQVHDVEVRTAEVGERVGVALKGADPDQIARGHTLAPPGSLPVSRTFRATLVRPCPYYRGRLAAGAQLHLQVGLQFVPAAVTAAGPPLTLEADRPVVLGPETVGVLADLSSAPRLVGRVALEPMVGPP